MPKKITPTIVWYFLFMLLPALTYAETCDEGKQRMTEQKYQDCLKKEKSFWEWGAPIPKDPTSRKDAYIIEANTINCYSRDEFINLYNRIKNSGGRFDPRKINSSPDSCGATQTSTFGRIVETIEGSNVVKIQFRTPYENKAVTESWTHMGLLVPMEQYLQTLAH